MTAHADRDRSEQPNSAAHEDQRWVDWHSAMLIAGLGRALPDTLPCYVTEAIRLADAEHAELRAEVAELRHRLEQRTQALHRTALDKDTAEAKVGRVEALLEVWEENGVQPGAIPVENVRAALADPDTTSDGAP
jgi:hypothetical protein